MASNEPTRLQPFLTPSGGKHAAPEADGVMLKIFWRILMAFSKIQLQVCKNSPYLRTDLENVSEYGLDGKTTTHFELRIV